MKFFPRSMPTAWRVVLCGLLGGSLVLLILSATIGIATFWGPLLLLPGIVLNGLYSRLDRFDDDRARALATLHDEN